MKARLLKHYLQFTASFKISLPKIKKNHRRASAGAQGENFLWGKKSAEKNASPRKVSFPESCAAPSSRVHTVVLKLALPLLIAPTLSLISSRPEWPKNL